MLGVSPIWFPFYITIFTILGCIQNTSTTNFLSSDVDLKVNEENLKSLLSEKEWKDIIGVEHPDTTFKIVHPILNQNTGKEKNILKIELENGDFLEPNFTIRLVPSPRLISSSFKYVETFNDTSNLIPHRLEELQCFHRSNKSALDLCQDSIIRGIIHSTNKDYFIIQPLPERFLKNRTIKPHIIIKKPIFNLNGDCSILNRNKTYGVINLDENLKSNTLKKRIKRDSYSPSPIFVETAVFVDKDLFEHMKTNYPVDTERDLIRFVLAMINAVQLLYHDPSLGRPVNFLLKRLEILKDETPGLTRSPDIDRYLSNFCNWQRTKNPAGDREPKHWDHAVILTGLDLYVRGKHGKISSQVVGLAPVAGMCTLTSSCTVNEGRHFESVYVVAHEIGHNLGMRHDGPMADNDCDPTSYIMSPTLGSGKITWSPCSRRYLETFLDTPQSRCLLDHGNSAGQLDHGAEGALPGERFDANQQCMLKYGKGSKHSSQQPLDDVCRDLHCERERYTWTSHPALEGTSCGHNLWCRGGKCVIKNLGTNAAYTVSKSIPIRKENIDGGWSDWKTYSECASGCLYGEEGRLRTGSTSIMILARLCNNPHPQGSGASCIGFDKKYQTCNAKQCLNVPRLTIKEYAEQICTRAKEVDGDLTGNGIQKIATDPNESCMIWCQKKNGGTKSRGWTYPDGTACLTKKNRYGRPSYCINGKCEEFHCDVLDEQQFVQQADLCPVDKDSNEITWRTGLRRRESNSVWISASGCHFNCISPGSGIRLVVKKGKTMKSSIQLCKPDQYGCGRIKSPFQHASMVCTKYKDKVRRLSGLGIQISPIIEDPDRPCRVACQDESIQHRFYLVNGEDGWFPFGTDCSKGNSAKRGYCISGKCLEFGSDDTPLSQTEFTLPLLSRNKRSLSGNSTKITARLEPHVLEAIIHQLNKTLLGKVNRSEVNEHNIDLKNPIHVNMEDDVENVSPHYYYNVNQEDYYNYT
nr:A disintegrin and metalloproteinase with thrombospondin motifs adt-1-like isoform X2 [Onthophagus taurus]